MSPADIKNIRIDHVDLKDKIRLDVMRLDLIHPIISGNKWFKLKEYLREAKVLDKKTIVTWGGAYSNHIVATALAAREQGFKSIGLVRGEAPANLSPSLQDAMAYGMELHFLNRQEYQQKHLPPAIHPNNEYYLIDEGGYGIQGAEGAGDILKDINTDQYTHYICAVGTGTTLAGISKRAEHQKTIGISVFKNNLSLQKEVEDLLRPEEKSRFLLVHDYHFGGYAKTNQALFQFMNDWFIKTRIPSDMVYTGKLFYAVNDLIQKQFFPPQSKLLVIHSGGLQGNRSLPKGTLIF
jgi:1-aminocyclopropane-1-carboxylate deaminase